MAFSPLAAARVILLADPALNTLISGRVFVPELNRKSPHQDPQDMPRACVVLKNTGGGSLGPGARSRAPWVVTRLDVESYGKNTEEAYEVHWAVYEVLTALGELPEAAGGRPGASGPRTVGDTLVHDAVVTGGPLNERDPDTDWPFVLGVFDLSAAYAT